MKIDKTFRNIRTSRIGSKYTYVLKSSLELDKRQNPIERMLVGIEAIDRDLKKSQFNIFMSI